MDIPQRPLTKDIVGITGFDLSISGAELLTISEISSHPDIRVKVQWNTPVSEHM